MVNQVGKNSNNQLKVITATTSIKSKEKRRKTILHGLRSCWLIMIEVENKKKIILDTALGKKEKKYE
jgi:hypothetical protein